MENKYPLSPARQLTEAEKRLVWKKPSTHVESEAERRICAEVRRSWNREEMKITNILLEGDAGSGKTQLAKALSANFNLPYTKITCFADMDKSDVLGSVLPVLDDGSGAGEVQYRFYPSEIVRAYENGWLLEIQEPTVIRDAAVLMALNSALEPDGSINLPTRIVHRHPDFIAVITTNRGYNGCRPLNEALRDRVQHTEKMDLPPKAVMMERAHAKTGFCNEKMLSVMADIIIVLDETARATAIKGVAGMRSYIFWVNAVADGISARESMYNKVIYKITTDSDEISILEQALSAKELIQQLEDAELKSAVLQNGDVMELHLDGDGEYFEDDNIPVSPEAVRLRKSADSEAHSQRHSDVTESTQGSDKGEEGDAIYHEMKDEHQDEQQKQLFRKKLNKEAREYVKGSLHEQVKLIVHRPQVTDENKAEYAKQSTALMPVIKEMVQKITPVLEHEISSEFMGAQLYGTKFCAERVASRDFRWFARKRPPEENPSLAVALRIDESASMSAFGRLDAAKQAAIALYEFCISCDIPVMIYGDTADSSQREQMSVYSYVDFESRDADEKYSLMNIKGRSNNRDGMALRIISERLLKAPQATKLCISISDGQPKAMPDYAGKLAEEDMKRTLQEYRRKGIIFLAAAIGQDKDVISSIYGAENTLNITELKSLPAHLVKIIARYL